MMDNKFYLKSPGDRKERDWIIERVTELKVTLSIWPRKHVELKLADQTKFGSLYTQSGESTRD